MSDFTRALQRAVFASILLTAACASTSTTPPPPVAASETVQPPPAPAVHQHATMVELPAAAGEDYTVADVRFMQNMIGHHAQAITMSRLAPGHGASENILKLAKKIDISQTDEIAFMKRWLGERKQGVPDDAQAHAMMMPGMLTPEMMTRLSAANGSEFDRLFLTYMIGHHEGALLMVGQLFKSPGAAQETEIFRFATDVDVDQRDEIYVMEKMLNLIPK